MSDKSVPQKLQMKPNHTVLFVNAPKGYETAIGPLPEGTFVLKKPAGHVDVIQVFVDSHADLERRLGELRACLGPAGILWVTYRRQTSAGAGELNRDTIRAYALSAGLQAVAQVAVDDEWSALRLKII